MLDHIEKKAAEERRRKRLERREEIKGVYEPEINSALRVAAFPLTHTVYHITLDGSYRKIKNV